MDKHDYFEINMSSFHPKLTNFASNQFQQSKELKWMRINKSVGVNGLSCHAKHIKFQHNVIMNKKVIRTVIKTSYVSKLERNLIQSDTN